MNMSIATAAAAWAALVVARIAERQIAFPAGLVLRTLELEEMAVVPGAHPALLGLAAAFGAPLPVVDGAWLLGDDAGDFRAPGVALLLATAHGRLAIPLDDRRSRVVHPQRLPTTRPAPHADGSCAPWLLPDLLGPGADALLVDEAALTNRLAHLRSFRQQPMATISA